MGLYIQVPQNQHKAEQIRDLHDGQIIDKPMTFDEVPEHKALICVIDNGPFEAAGYCIDEHEFLAFSAPDDRTKQWLLIDRQKAKELTRY